MSLGIIIQSLIYECYYAAIKYVISVFEMFNVSDIVILNLQSNPIFILVFCVFIGLNTYGLDPHIFTIMNSQWPLAIVAAGENI